MIDFSRIHVIQSLKHDDRESWDPHLRAPLLASTSTSATAKHSPLSLTRTATPVTDTATKQVAVTLAHGVSPASNGPSDKRYSSQQAPTADTADSATAYADRVEKVDSAVAAGGATETPTTNELQSHSSREVLLGESYWSLAYHDTGEYNGALISPL